MLPFGPSGIVRAVALIAALALFAGPSLPLHRADRLGPANVITLTRAVLVAWIAAALFGELSESAWLPLGLAGSLAFGLDWVDGQVARSTGWASDFGARLDMELDALTVLVLSGLCWQLDRAGLWAWSAGAMRYVYVLAQWGLPWMNRPLPPTNRRRFICGVQISTMLLGFLPWPAGLSAPIIGVGVLALAGSFGADVVWLARHRREPLVAT